MPWPDSSWIGPAVVAAVVSGVVAIVGFVISTWTARSLHSARLDADRALAERKIEADIALADRKFTFDVEFAARKRKVELVEPILSDFYRARDVLGWVCFPGSFGIEGTTRIRGENETEAQAQYLNSL